MVDRRSGVPAFRQVAADLRQKISTGTYSPGDQLPSERELTEAYDVSRPTVRDAINMLKSEGLVTSEHGRGVFVRPPATIQRIARARLSRAARAQNKGAFLADAASRGFTPSTSVKVRFEQADVRVAEHLAIEEGAEITVRDRVMRADGLVVQLAVSRLPRDFTRGTAIEEVDTGNGGTYARLEDAGQVIGRFIEHVGARMPTPDEASLLQLADGVPVVTVTRVAYSTEGKPLEMNDMILAGDRYELSYEWLAD
ncbi:GntR family transcriptional regulator [Amycolatopsis azurea]|uniref:Transcriptional regulator n=1 Tax=Amycolatopsis azurea DSM 43854 TaxID=1238180 RepID=M2P104_9PSEU|nr:GntR family transcriptional regulator [Amycolatopsis azurea]EMD28744.1 transcriptional regulatory protein [Amycolatopsis azurea DSM 43854]OOC07807.1 transcriptional regulator [Amycolatopsis azurea DSM 43854]WNS49801.1 Oca21 [Amycolatopsis azurea DSM 43854]